MYFTSDRHFFHKNMTKEGSDFCNRKFNTVEEMNDYLVKIHNQVVNHSDLVIDCGDMSLYNGRPELLFDIYSKMNGSFIIIKGNHDSNRIINYFRNNNYDYMGKPKFTFYDVGYRFKHNKNIYYCTHYPLDVGDRGKVFNIHGHIHNNESKNLYGTNVGVDSPEYDVRFGTPLSLKDIEERFTKKINSVI